MNTYPEGAFAIASRPNLSQIPDLQKGSRMDQQTPSFRTRVNALNGKLAIRLDDLRYAIAGHAQRSDLPPWRRIVGIGFGVVAGAGLVALAVAAIVAIVDLVGLGLKKAGEFASTVATSPIVDIAVDPVRNWITSHGEGLAVGTTGLAWMWATSGGVLFLMSTLRVRAARFIGWPGFGLATVAMAWDGSMDVHRPVASGMAALIWCLLSLVAFRRRYFT
ncbi:hypothetical protein [Amycolatopsis keratiniphila]|uniref:Transmembrane protein n=1 Tax=Amycolatopsis keratiniphila TaxID=129921 RepID=W6IBB3_9PSEU|nr:hypothetical protein [Amycolatopsis keratiniphila]AHJ58551.1 hypothetical protein AORI_P036 [Amycolatopsis keratiniphila]